MLFVAKVLLRISFVAVLIGALIISTIAFDRELQGLGYIFGFLFRFNVKHFFVTDFNSYRELTHVLQPDQQLFLIIDLCIGEQQICINIQKPRIPLIRPCVLKMTVSVKATPSKNLQFIPPLTF